MESLIYINVGGNKTIKIPVQHRLPQGTILGNRKLTMAKLFLIRTDQLFTDRAKFYVTKQTQV